MKPYLSIASRLGILVIFFFVLEVFFPPQAERKIYKFDEGFRDKLESKVTELVIQLDKGEISFLPQGYKFYLTEDDIKVTGRLAESLLELGVVGAPPRGGRVIFYRDGRKIEGEGTIFLTVQEARGRLNEWIESSFPSDTLKIRALKRIGEEFIFPSVVEAEISHYLPWIRRFLFALILLFSFLYLNNTRKAEFPNWSHIITIAASAFVVVVLTGISAREGLSPLFTAIPFFSVLISVAVGMEAAIFMAILLSFIIAIYFSGSFPVLVYNAFLSWVAAFSTKRFKNRFQIYFVVLIIFVTASLVAFFIELWNRATLANPVGILLAAFITAIFSGLLVLGALPIVEKIFGVSTDFLLLELSNLGNPLLMELSSKAPGTFTHSILVGNLCEAAARAIGANALLARVAAYYHDIGKMKNPQYFIENQVGGENPHDYLPPLESVKIIKSHVKEGVKIARSHGLPKPIIRIIETHHGTSLIKPIFEKVKDDKERLNENLFRYDGPKPKTKEEAICMLADAVEAAVRSMENPSPDELREKIGEIINEKFSEGQLDDADLTRRDIQLIRDAFYHVLIGIIHPRIEYPGRGEKKDGAGGESPEEKEAQKRVQEGA